MSSQTTNERDYAIASIAKLCNASGLKILAAQLLTEQTRSNTKTTVKVPNQLLVSVINNGTGGNVPPDNSISGNLMGGSI